MLAPHRRAVANMLSADPANPSVMSTVRLACGPASSVSGARRTPGSGMAVFHMRLIPCGAFIAVVISAGSLRWATAEASYRKNQANWSASYGLPATIRDAGSRHSHMVSATAPTR